MDNFFSLCLNDVVFVILSAKNKEFPISYSCGSNTLCIRSDSHGGSVLQAQSSCPVFVHFHKFEALFARNSVPCIVFFVVDQIYRFVFSFFGNGITVFVGLTKYSSIFSLHCFYFTDRSCRVRTAPEFDGI